MKSYMEKSIKKLKKRRSKSRKREDIRKGFTLKSCQKERTVVFVRKIKLIKESILRDQSKDLYPSCI